MDPATISTTPSQLFPRSESIYARSFYVAKADDGGNPIRVAFSRESLPAGGIPYEPGTGRDIVGDSAHAGMPLFAVCTVAGETAKVYRDEA